MMDLISEAVGGRVVDFNDEFFAEAANLIRADAPVWKKDEYTDRGKWMDGWETRRRREIGHDWSILALGLPGRIERVTIDTSHFTGNYPNQFSLEACGIGSDDRVDKAEWAMIVPRSDLRGDSVASFHVSDTRRVTHVRLNIFPDGGVARLRVEGSPIPGMHEVCPEGPTDLLSALVGGEALDASDKHYSDPSNLVRPTAPAGMWDGWETKRRRGPGHDWAVFRLGLEGLVESVIVDTSYFKGNSPGWISLELSRDGLEWITVIDRAPVSPDTPNELTLFEPAPAVFTRLSIHPDGGLARFRVMGKPSAESAALLGLEYVNALFEQQAREFFGSACASSAWLDEMTDRRPYGSPGEVLEAASSAFALLGDSDWLEAFAGHPRIGERGDSTANREQSGVTSASREVIARLATVNREYEDKFGFTYIVYATGKTAEEMLELAEDRLANGRDGEIANAAAEQRLITGTRLRRMMCMEDR